MSAKKNPDRVRALVLSLALLMFSLTNRRRILRAEAGLLLAAYISYVGWRVTLS